MSHRMMPQARGGPGAAGRALLAGLTLLVVGTGCTPLDDAMAAIFGRSMRDSRSFDPYENPRLPAEGSVPFASGNYPATMDDVGLGQAQIGPTVPDFTRADMAAGGEVAAALENPVPATEASLARGQLMYDRYCTVCHGPAGLSAEAPIAEKLPLVQAWNLAVGSAPGLTDGYIYGMIRVGRGAMPAYGHRITHFDRWHIVNYVRYLQQEAGGEQAGAGEEEAGETGQAGTGDAGVDGAGAADASGGDEAGIGGGR